MNTSVNDVGGTLTETARRWSSWGRLWQLRVEPNVIDRTGLTGAFDIELKWRPENLRSANAAQGSDLPSIFAALRSSSGCGLDSQRGPVNSCTSMRRRPTTRLIHLYGRSGAVVLALVLIGCSTSGSLDRGGGPLPLER
jgi:uncharacterized protein (TIGR03435 family)